MYRPEESKSCRRISHVHVGLENDMHFHFEHTHPIDRESNHIIDTSIRRLSYDGLREYFSDGEHMQTNKSNCRMEAIEALPTRCVQD